ncbi:MAG: 50S ribosomal protein L9 [candidate division WOR-3 bacterium]
MEVILIEDHPHLGERGKIVKVANGYARNYLIPKNIAIPNTPANRARIEAERKFEEVKYKKMVTLASEIKEKIEGKEFKIKVKAGKDGKLYGSVTKQDIVELLRKEGYEIDKKVIELDEAIKETGSYQIQLNLLKDVKTSINLIVEEDNSSKEEGDDRS